MRRSALILTASVAEENDGEDVDDNSKPKKRIDLRIAANVALEALLSSSGKPIFKPS